MPGARKIFVSHSSKDPSTSERLKQIVRGLRDSGYDPLVDRDVEDNIPAGVEWDRQLDQWLMDCHSAVILFTPTALRSGWVQKEATLLCMRRRREPGFQLFGVLLDGVTGEQLDADPAFRALRFSDYQFVRGCADAAQALAKLTLVLGAPDLAPPTPLDDLQRCIRDLLATSSPQTLVDAWNALPGGSKPPGPPHYSFEVAFARYVLREPEAALAHLHAVLQKLVHLMSQADAQQLRKFVMGLWVNAAAASRLATAREHGVALAMNGARLRKFTAEAYAERAWPNPVDYELIRISPGEWSADAIAAGILKQFEEPDDLGPEDQVDSFEACMAPIVVLLESNPAGQLPSRSTLQRLRQEFEARYSAEFSKVTLLLGVGPQLPDDLRGQGQTPAAGAAGVAIAPLLPELDLEEEQRQWQQDYDLRHLVRARATG